MPMSNEAIGLIVAEEVTDERTYRKKYQGFDWPGGDSGPTVGIGYDCGYCKPDEIRADWVGILDESAIAVLVSASGIRGSAAGAWVAKHRHAVCIPWTLAMRQFIEREVPKWERRLAAVYPQAMALPPDAKGALLSLIYNRGEGLKDKPRSNRRAEMRAIRDHLAAGRLDLVDDDIRAMVRLWPDVPGLRKRRLREADLFERGVKAMPSPAPVPVAEDTGGRMRHEPEPPPAVERSAELHAVSRKMRLMTWLQRALKFFGLGGTGAVTLADLTASSQGASDALRSLVSNPWLVGVAVVSVALIACVALLQQWSVDDYNSGRWQPSGGADGGAEDREPVGDLG